MIMETKDLKKLQIKIKKDLTKKKQNDKIIIEKEKAELSPNKKGEMKNEN